MSKRVFVFSRDEYFKLRLSVLCQREGLLLCELTDESEAVGKLIWDVDLANGEKVFPTLPHEHTLLVSRDGDFGRGYTLPVENAALLRFLREGEDEAHLTLDRAGRCARIYGKQIRLSELEMLLLSYLVDKGGECATSEELLQNVWHGDAGRGAVNVYIHYLREKLELRGERIILVRRGEGYCIEKKFLSEVAVC